MTGRQRLLAAAAAVLAIAGGATAVAQTGSDGLQQDPAGVISLQPGYSYTTLAVSCTPARSTESGATVDMPEDFDANVLFSAPTGEYHLLNNHELTQPRQGDFQGDATKCHVDEQRPGDEDSDGWGAVSRLVLEKDGSTVKRTEVITTGLHNLCAAARTPWKTYLTNEEFPFVDDPDRRSGWVWEIDPETGAQKRLTGMGRFSHEQEAYAENGSWYLTDDRGDFRFLYKFVPDSRRDLTTGELYGLAFNRATLTGFYVGPLDPLDPDADMRARGYQPQVWGFQKAEGIVASAGSQGTGGNEVVFSESASGTDPGRVWKLTKLSGETFEGRVLVEGDFARLSRPDNLRYTDAGDLFILEDNGSALGRPETRAVNEIYVLPRHEEGASNLVPFAETSEEPTGPWLSNDNRLLYLSIQAEPGPSRVIAIRHPANYNQPYDR